MVFTLRTGIEFLFQPLKTEDSDKVHVMVVGTSDGRLHLSIYDSFVIGDFRYVLPSSMHQPGVLQLVHHASHPATSTHSLLMRRPADEDRVLYLVPMDLPFIPSSPINLGLLASKLTTLQKLLRYVKQSQLHMVVEYKNTRELPARFVRAVQEDLEKSESGPTDIVQALFHTVVTGHAHDLIKEWLVDNLAERVSFIPSLSPGYILTGISGSQALGQGCYVWARKPPFFGPREPAARSRTLFDYPQPPSWPRPVPRHARRHRLLGRPNFSCERRGCQSDPCCTPHLAADNGGARSFCRLLLVAPLPDRPPCHL